MNHDDRLGDATSCEPHSWVRDAEDAYTPPTESGRWESNPHSDGEAQAEQGFQYGAVLYVRHPEGQLVGITPSDLKQAIASRTPGTDA